MSQLPKLLLFFVLATLVLSWVPWPFTIISQPKQAKPTYLAFTQPQMKKNETISLQLKITVIQQSYTWFGKKGFILEDGSTLHGSWIHVPPNGTYYKDEELMIQFAINTGQHKGNQVVYFVDESQRIKVRFCLPSYKGGNGGNGGKGGRLGGGEGELMERYVGSLVE